MRDKWQFSDAQALSTLDSTGVVSSNVFDLELAASGGDTIITDDFIDCWVIVLTTACPSTQAGAEGMNVRVLANDNADMTTGTEVVLASIDIIATDITTPAGKKFPIRVYKQLTAKFLGVWYRAVSTGLTTGVIVDCWWDIGPRGENDSIQKVPSRS
jgi:hypothetical protein